MQVGSSASHPVFADLAAAISAVLDEDVQSSKAPFVSRMQQCFAVKTGRDGFLDLARANFCRISEDIHKLAASYSDQYSLSLKVKPGLSCNSKITASEEVQRLAIHSMHSKLADVKAHHAANISERCSQSVFKLLCALCQPP